MSRKRMRSLWNMAMQDVSPNESSIAISKLSDGGWATYLPENGGIGPAILVDQRFFKRYEDLEDWIDMREHGTFCPGCKHSEYQHVAAMCYTCGNCGWSVVSGNWFRGLRSQNVTFSG